MIKSKIKIQGMSCASCASKIQKATSEVPGVISSQINFATEQGFFEVESKKSLEKIHLKIGELGYKVVSSLEEKNNNSNNELKLLKFWISLTLAIFIFLFEMGPLKGWPTLKISWFIQLLLSFPIWIWIGLPFQKSLLKFLRTGQSNMNTLIGLGTTSAFAYSILITIFSDFSLSLGLTQKVYFEAIGFIISFVFLGQYLEEKAKRKTKEALSSLLKLSAKKATILIDEQTKEIDIKNVRVNDVIRVKPGEKFPVDGNIVSGISSIDESMISGEPMPVLKSNSDFIYAGAINGDQVIDYKASKVGENTFLSQIIQYVENAQSSRPEIQKYADYISSFFTPVAMIISIITFVSWYFFGPTPKWGNSISNFIAVLVIACPCALGLATPTAVVVSTGRASLKGLLIGGGEVLEKGAKIDTIIFDKTGTITQGKPSVIDSKFKEENLVILKEVASIEKSSEHPISKAIVNFSKEKQLNLSDPDYFEIVKGKGIKAKISENTYIIGNERLLKENKIELDTNLLSNEVGTLVYISKNSEHVGTIVIGDELKPNVSKLIKKLKNMGITTWMITGDNELAAKAVAEKISVDYFIANTLPLDKSKYITDLQEKGHFVAMIGDGINDGPALAKADLSMAMGTGSDVAINASDVTIVKGDLSKALDFINLSHGTMNIIKQNLFLSMIYNVSLIPVAAGVLYLFGGPLMPPILASFAMALSSVSVVSNSLRIKKLI